MDRLKFINGIYSESKNRIDDKSNLTWNNIVFLLGLFEKEITQNIKYKLLKKYIEHIADNEGIDYLSDTKIKYSNVNFTEEEVKILRSL
jgi:hypothetical protein